ncbi:S-layer protein [Fusobacterium mortiferum]|uniref:S-layer protein n=1 Tax=Fusobacterium mortiferum TaxID=850 RepID=UPI00158C9BFF|nr:S-layer protein [Fusobacterium mortiferum]
MNKKKIVYGIIFIVVIVLGYLNYFGDEGELGKTEQVIETSNVTYKNEDYVVEAQLQKDYIKENETGFEKAKAKVNDMLISGDNVFIDKVRNLALKNNILGISPNGWSFKAESVDYNKLKDEIKSTTGVTAINEEQGIKISGQNFTTDSKMSYIELTQDVVLENESIALKGDKGEYDDLTKIVVLSNNIILEGRGENVGLVDGHFKTLRYNSDSRILEAWEPFDTTYKEVKLSAESLYFKEDTEALKVSKNVVIEANGFKIYVDRVDKAGNSNILKIAGKIKGSDGTYSFEGDKGEYNTESKVLTILGNIKGSSTKGEKIAGDRLVYDTNSKLMTLSGDKNVKYSSADGELITKVFNYNSETKEMSTSGAYTFSGTKYESKGKNLYYNGESKDVKITEGYLLDKEKKQRLSGDKIAYNTDTQDSSVIGKAFMEDEKYSLSSESIIYTGADKNAKINGNYIVKAQDSGMKFQGKDATYNQESGEFLSAGSVKLQNENYIANGTDLTYNTKTGLGKLGSSIEIVNPKDNIRITGDTFSFKNGEYLEIAGNLHMEGEDVIVDSERARYSLKDKNIYIPEKIDFKSKDGKTYGIMSKGVYYTESSKFVGDNFNGKSNTATLTSRKMTYFSQGEKALFQGKVVMKDTDSTFRGESVEYYPKTETVKSLEKYTINYKDFTFKGDNGVFNNKSGILDGNKSDITTANGDRFISDKVHGNLNEMIMDFTGNVNGHVNDNGVITTFSGEFSRVYFKNSGKYEILRSEVRENAVFIQGDKKLKSDYIEIDSNRRLVFSKENTELTLVDAVNGETVIKSAVAEVDIDKDMATLIGNVQIKNNNSEYGLTNVTADRGIIRQKAGTVELIGHVEIENNESIVQADRGIYDMNSKKIKASGNVYVDYKK